MATNEQRREAAKRKLAAQQAHRVERAQKQKRNTTIAVVATVLVVAVAAGGVYALTAAWGGGDTEPADPAAQAQQDTGPDTSGLPVVPLPTRPTIQVPVSSRGTAPPGPSSAVEASTSTIGSRRRAAAIASPSRVWAFSRCRSASISRW